MDNKKVIGNLSDEMLQQLLDRRNAGESLESITWGLNMPVNYVGRMLYDYELKLFTKPKQDDPYVEVFVYPDLTIEDVVYSNNNLYLKSTDDVVIYSQLADKYIAIHNSHEEKK